MGPADLTPPTTRSDNSSQAGLGGEEGVEEEVLASWLLSLISRVELKLPIS